MYQSNPLFRSVNVCEDSVSTNTATYSGVTLKTLLFLGLAGIVAIIAGIGLYKVQNVRLLLILLFASIIVGFIAVILGRSNPKRAAVCGSIYSVCEGMLLGTITAVVNIFVPGAAILAIGATALTFLSCLAIFAAGFMRNVKKLSKFLLVLFMSIILVSIFTIICDLLNIGGVATFIEISLPLAIGIEALFVLYGAIMLFLNFNEATSYVQNGASKEFEWVAAFGLLLSILYIYLEILRLVLIIASSSKRK